jgi:hypothetical protein
MPPDRAHDAPAGLWKAHPDDATDVREAMECADRNEFLSPRATEAFLRWMEGVNDETWREELE